MPSFGKLDTLGRMLSSAEAPSALEDWKDEHRKRSLHLFEHPRSVFADSAAPAEAIQSVRTLCHVHPTVPNISAVVYSHWL